MGNFFFATLLKTSTNSNTLTPELDPKLTISKPT